VRRGVTGPVKILEERLQLLVGLEDVVVTQFVDRLQRTSALAAAMRGPTDER